MTYVGFLAGMIIFAAIWAMFATGRKSWIIPAFWAWIVLVEALGVKGGMEVNGLCLCIALFETVMSIRAIYGIVIWNQSFKERGVALPIVIYLISAVPVGYCVIQIQKLGYVPDIMGIKTEMSTMRKLVNIVVIFVLSICPAYVGLLRFERFFSTKTTLTLLDCRFYTTPLMGGTIFKGYYMYGINNGVKYHFRITKRIYFMLRFEKRLVMNVYKDLRGNMFVVKNPCPGNLKSVAGRDIRMAKNIAMSAVVFIVIMVIIL